MHRLGLTNVVVSGATGLVHVARRFCFGMNEMQLLPRISVGTLATSCTNLFNLFGNWFPTENPRGKTVDLYFAGKPSELIHTYIIYDVYLNPL